MKFTKHHKTAVKFVALLTFLTSIVLTHSLAYYDWGPVTLTLGETDVQINQGAALAITAQVSPVSDEQLPGCGMAQCPQQCGPGCVNEQGDCQCAGTTYQTYYATVKISSSDATIVKASYKAGVVTLTGVAPGQAIVSVTGSLRQYSDTTKEIKVTILAAAQTGGAPSPTVSQQTSQPTPSSSPMPDNQKPSASAEIPQPTTSSESSAIPSASMMPGSCTMDMSNAETEQNNAQNNTKMGNFMQVELVGEDIAQKEAFASVQGKDVSLTFSKKAESGNVLYSWTFRGTDITSPSDIDLTVNDHATSEGAIRKLIKQQKDIKFFSFDHHGQLPGMAEIYLCVGEQYNNGQKLRLYRYDEEKNKLELSADNLKVDNGYVTFHLGHCSDYVLMPVSPSSWYILTALGTAVLVVGTASVLIIRKSPKTRGESDKCDD